MERCAFKYFLRTYFLQAEPLPTIVWSCVHENLESSASSEKRLRWWRLDLLQNQWQKGLHLRDLWRVWRLFLRGRWPRGSRGQNLLRVRLPGRVRTAALWRATQTTPATAQPHRAHIRGSFQPTGYVLSNSLMLMQLKAFHGPFNQWPQKGTP